MTVRPAARPAARPRITLPRPTQEQRARIHAALEALLKRIRDALRPLAQALREAAAAMARATAALARPPGRPARPDRPAWASSYGPAPRHRSYR